MKKLLLFIPFALSVSGCLNPNLCGVEGTVHGGNLTQEHLQYFEGKPTYTTAEAHGTILPVIHVRESLQKRPVGYSYRNHLSLLGGLLYEFSSSQSFDQEGTWDQDGTLSASSSWLSGLLYRLDVESDVHNLNGFVSKSVLLKSFGSYREVGGRKYYTILWMPMDFSKLRPASGAHRRVAQAQK